MVFVWVAELVRKGMSDRVHGERIEGVDGDWLRVYVSRDLHQCYTH